jgi:hypothetical protein
MRVHATKLGAISTGRGLGDQLYDLAGEVPSLDLNFAGTKTLGPLVTFTRAGSGTFTDSTGTLQTAATDVPRFDHNPTTGESLGLLVEEAKTNLLLRSEEFDDASWTVNPGAKTVTANTTVAPNGILTADTVTANGTSAVHFVDQTVTLTAISYVFTVYAKAGTNNFIQLRASAALGNRHANFDVSTGAAGTNGNITSSNIEFVGNGWYRCSMVFTSTAATGTLAILLVTSNTVASGESNSLNTSVILWGAQLEAGAGRPTSYIATTGATATRAADVASITGSAFSSWYNQTEGTVFADITVLSTVKTNQVISIDDGTTNNRIEIRVVGAATVMLHNMTAGGVAQNNGSITVGTDLRRVAALSYRSGDTRLQSGNIGTAFTGATVPTVTQIQLNKATFANGEINGTIRRLTYWPTRLANTTLQSITAS